MPPARHVALAIIVRIVVSTVLLVAGAVVFVALVRTHPEPARFVHAGAPPRIAVIAVRPVEVGRQWRGFGTAEAMDSADVPARITATVLSVPPEIVAGAWVEMGQPLARLDESDFLRQQEIAHQTILDIDAQLGRLAIEQGSWQERSVLAKEQVALATAEFDRTSEAVRRAAANQREVDFARQALIASIRDEIGAREELDKLLPRRLSLEALRAREEALLRLASQSVERCTIVSPLAGYLQSVDVEHGESLSTGQRVARVVSLGAIEVTLRLPASARSTVRAGDEVTLSSTVDRARTWASRIARIEPEVDVETRTLGAVVEVRQDPKAPALSPGEFVAGSVSASDRAPRWIVPRSAIDAGRVLLVEEGRIVRRLVEIDFEFDGAFPSLAGESVLDDHWVALRGALPEGSLVVVNAARSLPDGLAVEPVPAAPPSRADPSATITHSAATSAASPARTSEGAAP